MSLRKCLFLIWAAGIRRNGNVIGLHRPTIDSKEFGALSPNDASSVYASLISDVERYLSQMEVPRIYVDLMMATDSEHIRWLNGDERESMRNVPSIEEWLNSACGNDSEANHTSECKNNRLRKARG
jgi:hypothetical protein